MVLIKCQKPGENETRERKRGILTVRCNVTFIFPGFGINRTSCGGNEMIYIVRLRISWMLQWFFFLVMSQVFLIDQDVHFGLSTGTNKPLCAESAVDRGWIVGKNSLLFSSPSLNNLSTTDHGKSQGLDWEPLSLSFCYYFLLVLYYIWQSIVLVCAL